MSSKENEVMEILDQGEAVRDGFGNPMMALQLDYWKRLRSIFMQDDQTNNESPVMELGSALAIVYDLAVQNALDIDDPELYDQAEEQHEALAVVHDYIVNHYGEH